MIKIELRHKGERIAIGDMKHVPRRGEVVEFIAINDGMFLQGKVEQVTSRHYTTFAEDPRVIIDLSDLQTMTGESIE